MCASLNAFSFYRKWIQHLLTTAIALHMTSVLAQSPPSTCSPEGVQQQVNWQLMDKSPDNHVCVKPGVDWSKFGQYQIEPASYDPADPRQTLKQPDADKLISLFDVKLHSSYKDQTGTGSVLKIKPVITGVKRSIPMVNAIGFLLVPVPLTYGGASVRYDLIDNATGETVGVVTSKRSGRPWNGFQSLSSLGHSRLVLSGDAKRIKRDTDRLQKISPAAQSTFALLSTGS